MNASGTRGDEIGGAAGVACCFRHSAGAERGWAHICSDGGLGGVVAPSRTRRRVEVTGISAARALEGAVAEQARCAGRYDRSIGTSAELSAYMGLKAASREVRECELALRNAQAEFAFWVLADATAPGEARREVTQRIGGRVGARVLETIQLLVSEAVTNAVIHGAQPELEPIGVDGRLSADRFRLEVTNAGPPFVHVAELPPASASGGRGLFLVDALALAWAHEHDAGTTNVWFEVAA